MPWLTEKKINLLGQEVEVEVYVPTEQEKAAQEENAKKSDLFTINVKEEANKKPPTFFWLEKFGPKMEGSSSEKNVSSSTQANVDLTKSEDLLSSSNPEERKAYILEAGQLFSEVVGSPQKKFGSFDAYKGVMKNTVAIPLDDEETEEMPSPTL